MNPSKGVSYHLNRAGADDTLNINGCPKIPAGTLMETTLSYFIGGNNVIASEYNSSTYPLNKSDFTITLSSGNTLEVNRIDIVNIKSSQPNPPDATIEIMGMVAGAAYLTASISVGQIVIIDQTDDKEYYLETMK